MFVPAICCVYYLLLVVAFLISSALQSSMKICRYNVGMVNFGFGGGTPSSNTSILFFRPIYMVRSNSL